MKRWMIALSLLAALVQSGCRKDDESRPPEPVPTPVVTVAKEKSSVVVCIESKAPDTPSAHVKAGKKQDLAWKSHDNAYKVWFNDANWGFAEDPDAEETVGGVVYKGVLVPAKGMSRNFTLDYELTSGATKEHHYRIDYDPPSGPPDPPNGPVIVGDE